MYNRSSLVLFGFLAAAVGELHSPARSADLSAHTAAVLSPWDIGFGSALMSDYNFRGISASARRPSVTIYLEPHYTIDPALNLYAGVSGSSVDLPNRASSQFVYYAGIRPTAGALAFDVGLSYTDYPGGRLFNGVASSANCTNGEFFLGQCNISKAVVGFSEGYAKATWNASNAISLGSNVYYAPSYYNTGAPGTYVSVTAKASLPDVVLPKDIGAFLSGELGHYWFGRTDAFYGSATLPDYTTWNVGLTFTYKVFSLDLRYFDTDLSKANCNVLTGDQTATFGGPSAATSINPSGLVSNWCGAAFIVKLGFDATLAGLK
jgi:uncharacterized protein (TIGR02001 family)